jgi:hypothetical protein
MGTDTLNVGKDYCNKRTDIWKVHPIMCLAFFACVCDKPSATEATHLRLPSPTASDSKPTRLSCLYLPKLLLIGCLSGAILAVGVFPTFSHKGDTHPHVEPSTMALGTASRELLLMRPAQFGASRGFTSGPGVSGTRPQPHLPDEPAEAVNVTSDQRTRVGIAAILMVAVMTIGHSSGRSSKRPRADWCPEVWPDVFDPPGNSLRRGYKTVDMGDGVTAVKQEGDDDDEVSRACVCAASPRPGCGRARGKPKRKRNADLERLMMDSGTLC